MATDTQMGERLTTMLTEIDEITKKLKVFQTDLKKLQKEHQKLQKKHTSKKTKVDENGNKIVQKTGFALPVPLSDQLCAFLKMPLGTHLSRTDVTREVNKYIKEQKLQDPENGRNILPDKLLKELLQPGQDDVVSYFNLQRYLSPHFSKLPKVDASTIHQPVKEVVSTPHTTPTPTPTPAEKKKTSSRKPKTTPVSVTA